MARHTDPQTLGGQRAAFLEMMRDAKVSRDERGVTDAKADAQLERAENGDFGTLVRADSSQSAGRLITGVKEKGTGIVETTYTYAPIPKGDGNGHARTALRMTTPQENWILRLLDMVPADVKAKAEPWFNARREGDARLSLKAASDAITRLKKHAGLDKPREWTNDGDRLSDARPPAKPAQPAAQAPASAPRGNAWSAWRQAASDLVGHRYATTGDDGTTDFWYISEWERDDGRKFITLRQVIGGQGNVRVRMSPEAMVTIANKIKAQGIKESILRFGREIGACGHCGRTLTNDESRALGIGPICHNRMGW